MQRLYRAWPRLAWSSVYTPSSTDRVPAGACAACAMTLRGTCETSTMKMVMPPMATANAGLRHGSCRMVTSHRSCEGTSIRGEKRSEQITFNAENAEAAEKKCARISQRALRALRSNVASSQARKVFVLGKVGSRPPAPILPLGGKTGAGAKVPLLLPACACGRFGGRFLSASRRRRRHFERISGRAVQIVRAERGDLVHVGIQDTNGRSPLAPARREPHSPFSRHLYLGRVGGKLRLRVERERLIFRIELPDGRASIGRRRVGEPDIALGVGRHVVRHRVPLWDRILGHPARRL